MFEEIMGIPAHPLLVHVAVVLVPGLALVAALYALVPAVRSHLRWVLAALAVIAPGAALFAEESGEKLLERMSRRDLIGPELSEKIHNHEEFGELTFRATLVLAIISLALVYLVPPRAPAPIGVAPHNRARPKLVSFVLISLTVLSSTVAVYLAVRVGHSGADAVWRGI